MIDQAGPERTDPFEASPENIDNRRAPLDRNPFARVHGGQSGLGGQTFVHLQLEAKTLVANDETMTALREPDDVLLETMT